MLSVSGEALRIHLVVKGGEVLWSLSPHFDTSSHHSSWDSLKTPSTCCLGRGKKKKKKEKKRRQFHRKRTHSGSRWAVIKYKSYTGDGPLSETPRDNNSSSAHTHTHNPVSIDTQRQGKTPALHAATSTTWVRFVCLSARKVKYLVGFCTSLFSCLCIFVFCVWKQQCSVLMFRFVLCKAEG